MTKSAPLSRGQRRSAGPTPTLAAIVQSKISADIASGLLRPGMRLEELDLASRYNVSRTPVREALRNLASIGSVDGRARQGMVVARLSSDRLRSLLEVTADLEASSARYASERMTPLERRRLRALHDQMQLVVDQTLPADFDRMNRQFHSQIHKGAHNEILFDGIEQLRHRAIPYTRVEMMTERRQMAISHAEHGAIVNAITTGDSQLAYHAMRAHVLHAGTAPEDKTELLS